MKRKFPYDNHDDSEEKRGRPYSNGSVSDGNNAIHPQVANQIKSSTRIAFVIRKNKKHKHFGKKLFFPLKSFSSHLDLRNILSVRPPPY